MSSLAPHRVEIIGNTSWGRTGRGFDIVVDFEALLHTLKPGGDPQSRGGWETRYLSFDERWTQAVRDHLRDGREPLFELFRADVAFRSELEALAPDLASRYEKWDLASVAPGPDTGSTSQPTRI